jgi:hypothetical protein
VIDAAAMKLAYGATAVKFVWAPFNKDLLGAALAEDVRTLGAFHVSFAQISAAMATSSVTSGGVKRGEC